MTTTTNSERAHRRRPLEGTVVIHMHSSIDIEIEEQLEAGTRRVSVLTLAGQGGIGLAVFFDDPTDLVRFRDAIDSRLAQLETPKDV